MKIKYLLFVFSVILLSSCSTVYKSGQTPDDLYYSKPKTADAVVTVEEDREDLYGDRQIRIGVRDARWRTLNDRYDYDYRYSPYYSGYAYGYGYNPYYCPYPGYNAAGKYVLPKNTTIRNTNLNNYNNTTTTTNTSGKGGTIQTTERRRYNNSNDEPRENTRSYETRTYNPPANSGSSTGTSSSSSSSSGSSVTRPVRGR